MKPTKQVILAFILLASLIGHTFAGTIKVPSQVLNAPITAQADTVYDLTATTLTRTSAGYCIVIPAGVNNVTIKNGVLTGGGIKADQTNGTIIDGVTVMNTFASQDGATNNAFNFTTFTNSKLLNTRSLNISGTAVWLWRSINKSEFRNNYVEGAGEGLHSFHRGGVTSEDVVFANNEVRKCRRHGFEFQNYGKARRWKIINNLAHDWVTFPDWNGHMAFSIAMGGSESGIELDKGPGPYANEDMLVEGNVALASGDLLDKFKNGTTPWQNSTAFEIMGDVAMRGNYTNGFPHPCLVEYVRAGKWTMENNAFLTWVGGPQIKPGKGYPNFEIVNGVGYNADPVAKTNYLGTSGDRPIPAAGVNAPPATQPTTLPTTQPVPTTTDYPLFFDFLVDGQMVVIKRTVRVTGVNVTKVEAATRPSN